MSMRCVLLEAVGDSVVNSQCCGNVMSSRRLKLETLMDRSCFCVNSIHQLSEQKAL